jgi:hypothetical protein
MKRFGLLSALIGVTAIVLADAAIKPDTAAPTFSKDVAPILQKNCQSCHRPGQIAPMSLLTYAETRPWARSIKTKVESRQMPPWFADPRYGHFMNDRSLTQSQIDTIVKWVDNGAPQGDPKDAPAPIAWPENGWFIKPDIVVRGPAFSVPAHPKENVIEWTNITVPSGFTRDTWITSLEIKPSDLSVTHHICISFAEHRDDVQYYTPVWREPPRDDEGIIIRQAGAEPPAARPGRNVQGGEGAQGAAGGAGVPPGTGTRTVGAGGFEGCYVPGTQVADYRPFHAGKLVPANFDIVLQLHYTPSGKATVDIPEIGFTVAATPPEKRYISYALSGAGPTFAIPPNEGNYQSPPVEATFNADAELVDMMPHMHLRGKDMTYHLIYPGGRDEVVLDVPHYDFNWQVVYNPATPVKIPKGTKLHVDAHYDNSAANKFNPNPNRTVYPGTMTWEEMMAPFFGVVVDRNVDPRAVLQRGRLTVEGSGA